MESITCQHRQTKQKCFPSTPDTGQKSTASQKQRCNFRAVKQTLYLRRQIFNLRDFCLQMNKHTGHSKKVQHAQNGALFNVLTYFLNACIHIGKINDTKAFVLSNNSINIAYQLNTKTLKKWQKTQKNTLQTLKTQIICILTEGNLKQKTAYTSTAWRLTLIILSIIIHNSKKVKQ